MISQDQELRGAEESFDPRNPDPPVVLHPLPMPEYGGYFAQLTEFLPDISLESQRLISGFHRWDFVFHFLSKLNVLYKIPTQMFAPRQM